MLSLIGRALPTSLPRALGGGPGAVSPAVALERFVEGQILRFQSGVTAKAAAHRAETRWWWRRRWDGFTNNFRWEGGH